MHVLRTHGTAAARLVPVLGSEVLGVLGVVEHDGLPLGVVEELGVRGVAGDQVKHVHARVALGAPAGDGGQVRGLAQLRARPTAGAMSGPSIPARSAGP